MAKKVFENEMASHSLQHMAKCDTCHYNGPWETDIELAYKDASQHRQKNDNKNHILRIITNQTISRKFVE